MLYTRREQQQQRLRRRRRHNHQFSNQRSTRETQTQRQRHQCNNISSLHIVMMVMMIGEVLVMVDGWNMLSSSVTTRRRRTTTNSNVCTTAASYSYSSATTGMSTVAGARRSLVSLSSSSSKSNNEMASGGENDEVNNNNSNNSNNKKKNNDDDEEEDYSDLSPSMRKRIRLAKAQAEIDRILNHPVDPPFDFETMMEKVISISHPETKIPSTTTTTTTTTTASSSSSDPPPSPAAVTTTTAATESPQSQCSSTAENSGKEQQTTNEEKVVGGDDKVVDPTIMAQTTAVEDSTGSSGSTTKDSNRNKNIVDLDEHVSQVESELYDAVKAQDFDTAAQKQSELSQLHIDDCGLVLQANSAFYKAFSDKDVREMERIWLKDRACVCIHPSFKVLTGIRSIMHAWRRMFESSSGSFQRTWMEPDKIQLTVRATTAVVTCEELVYAKRFVRGKKREVELVNRLTASNLFRKVGGRWYMTHHHSSWHADSHAAQVALQRKNNKPGQGKQRGQDLQRNGNSSGSDAQDDDDRTGIESILGTSDFGPVLGDDEPNDRGDPDRPSIVLGSLGDLLGNFKPKGPPLNDDINSNMDSDDAIIHFEEIHIEDNDEHGDASDGEDDDGDYSEPLTRWIDRSRRIRKKVQHSAQTRGLVPPPGGPSSSLSGRPLKTDQETQQECIQALRKLANQGRISQKQKRVLITDIISCSSRAENSMVVTAYNLLCTSDGSETPDDDSEEDFADQCLVLADSLLTNDIS
mmetsp:Transcript_5579/g.13470  ORF Transcript_5579/g.13470 Transcript_5579/m.13470 type:complete len:749 (+) Transcript_5579:210-2456(+)